MKKKLVCIILTITILIIAATAILQVKSNKSNFLENAMDKMPWGISQEEALKVLGIKEYTKTEQEKKTELDELFIYTNILIENFKVHGSPAVVLLTFMKTNTDQELGLSSIKISYKDNNLEAVKTKQLDINKMTLEDNYTSDNSLMIQKGQLGDLSEEELTNYVDNINNAVVSTSTKGGTTLEKAKREMSTAPLYTLKVIPSDKDYTSVMISGYYFVLTQKIGNQ